MSSLVIINDWACSETPVSYRGVYRINGPYLYGSPPPDACGTDEELHVMSFKRESSEWNSSVLDYLATNKSTTSVTLDNRCSIDGFTEFTEILRQNTHWKHLTLKYLFNPNWGLLARALRQNTGLKSLTMFIRLNTPLEQLESALMDHPSLTQLRFEGHITKEGVDIIVSVSGGNTRLTRIVFEKMTFYEGLQSNPKPMNQELQISLLNRISTNMAQLEERRKEFTTLLLCLQAGGRQLPLDILTLLRRFVVHL